MKSLFALSTIAAWFAIGACVATAAPPAAPALRAMTYNLRYASDQPPNAWPDRLPVAVAMLDELAPHVIGCQEALYRQVRDLDRKLPNYDWIGTGRDGGSRGEFMAVFYDKQRLEPLEFDHFWLSDTPEVVGSATWGNSNRRMVTWVRFLDRTTERQFLFVNTHFDHQIEEARVNSALLILDRVANLAPQMPLLLVGDFNAAAGASRPYELLVDSGAFFDTWDRAEEKSALVNTFHGFRGPREGDSRIDWILGRGAVRTLHEEIVLFEQGGQYPSDHFPIYADVLLGQNEADGEASGETSDEE